MFEHIKNIRNDKKLGEMNVYRIERQYTAIIKRHSIIKHFQHSQHCCFRMLKMKSFPESRDKSRECCMFAKR